MSDHYCCKTCGLRYDDCRCTKNTAKKQPKSPAPNVSQFPVQQETKREPPKKIKRPCHYGLESAIWKLESQLGSVGAYNALCEAAEALKAKIDAGKGQAQMLMYATDPNCIYPKG